MNSHEVNVERFKVAMANYPTGVSVVTTIDENGVPAGLTINSFASVSLDPLLVLWSIGNGVSTYEAFENTEKFAVNILNDTQKDLATLFSSKEHDRFTNCKWEMSEHKLPLFTEAAATLQCKLYKRVVAGDHLILIGEIIDMHVNEVNPLLYHNRKLAAFPEDFDEV